MDKGISRRSFLTGGSAIGALAAFGITGCASEVGSESRSAADEADWKQSLNVDIASTLPGNTDESVDVSKTVECDVAVIGGRMLRRQRRRARRPGRFERRAYRENRHNWRCELGLMGSVGL